MIVRWILKSITVSRKTDKNMWKIYLVLLFIAVSLFCLVSLFILCALPFVQILTNYFQGP